MQMVRKKQKDSIRAGIRYKKIGWCFHLVKNWWDTECTEFKVNCIKLEPMMFVRFCCTFLMIKDTY